MSDDNYTWKVRDSDVRIAEKTLAARDATLGDYRDALATLLSFAEEVEDE